MIYVLESDMSFPVTQLEIPLAIRLIEIIFNYLIFPIKIFQQQISAQSKQKLKNVHNKEFSSCFPNFRSHDSLRV